MDLSDRLRALGVRLGTSTPLQRVEIGEVLNQDSLTHLMYSVEKVVEGSDLSTEFGTVFSTQKIFTPGYIHGKIRLNLESGLSMLSAWGKTPHLAELDPQQIVFLDTETSGLAGGTGTYAFLVGLGVFREEGFVVTQFFMRDPESESAILAALNEFLAPYQAVVTFNGKSFDLPLLRTRMTLNSFPSPWNDLDHIDLLHLARRLWRNRLESRALGDLEREIICFTRDQEEVPGFLIPQVYFDYLRTGDARPLAGVFYHNVIDIVTLSALFIYTASILEDPQQSLLPSLDIIAIARLYEDAGYLEKAADLYALGLAEGLPQEVYFSSVDRFASLRRKQGQPDLAAMLWEKSARLGNVPAYIELSKILEHTLRRNEDALSWAREGLNLAHSKSAPRYQLQIWEEEFSRRIQRLEKKVLNARK